MEKHILNIEGLKKYYNRNLALDIPKLAFERNAVHMIMGPNGSGKSTLLEIIALLEKPSSGKIYYNNELIGKNHNRIRKEITLVMQFPFLFNTTVFKNIAYGLNMRANSERKRRQKVMEILERMNLTEFGERNARELSAGEMRKVAIARAIVLEPEILLLDEPTSELDEKNIELVERIIKSFGKTVIMVTQSKGQAMRLGDMVFSMSEGGIE